jgi:hypothetical protein
MQSLHVFVEYQNRPKDSAFFKIQVSCYFHKPCHNQRAQFSMLIRQLTDHRASWRSFFRPSWPQFFCLLVMLSYALLVGCSQDVRYVSCTRVVEFLFYSVSFAARTRQEYSTSAAVEDELIADSWGVISLTIAPTSAPFLVAQLVLDIIASLF